MIKHETNIDNVAFQLDFVNEEEQRSKLSLLCQWIAIREIGLLEQDKGAEHIIKYNVNLGARKLFTIHSGRTTKRDKLTGEFIKQYYIRIRFAGLKSQKQRIDEISYYALMTICAWLNTTRTNFRLVELDVAIDIYSSFYNVLATCITKSANVQYNRLGNIKLYEGIPTSYMEDYNREQEKYAVLRAYLYDKFDKEELNTRLITRFELKLQNRFFLKNEFNVKSIMNALDRYYVMYFENEREKEQKINEYNKYKMVTAREINRLRFEKYRLYPNHNVIKEFIRQIQSVYVGFNWDIVVPVVMHPNSNANRC